MSEQATDPEVRKNAMILIGAAAVVTLAAFMPWASIGIFTKSGIDGDGSITAVLGLIGVGAGVAAMTGNISSTLTRISALLGVAALLVGIIDFADISGVEGASVGIGICLTIVGGVVMAAFAWQLGGLLVEADDSSDSVADQVE